MKILKIIGGVVFLFVCFLGASGMIGEFIRSLKNPVPLQAEPVGSTWSKTVNGCHYSLYYYGSTAIGICECAVSNDTCGISVAK